MVDQREQIVGLRESEQYSSMKAQYGDPRLMDEVQRGFDLILGRNPLYGDPVSVDSHLFVFRTTPYPPRVPGYRVLYYYDPDNDPYNIDLLAIERLPPVEDEAM